MPQSWCGGRQRMSGRSWMGLEMNGRRGQGKEGEKRWKGKEERLYHDIFIPVIHDWFFKVWVPSFIHCNYRLGPPLLFTISNPNIHCCGRDIQFPSVSVSYFFPYFFSTSSKKWVKSVQKPVLMAFAPVMSFKPSNLSCCSESSGWWLPSWWGIDQQEGNKALADVEKLF